MNTDPTTHPDVLEAVLDTYDTLLLNEEPVIELEVATVPDKLEAITQLMRLQKAIGLVRKQVEAEVAEALGKGGVTRYGETIFAYQTTWTEKVMDPHAALEYLAAHPEVVKASVNPNTLKKGSLPKEVRDSFFHREPGPPKLTSRPVNDPKLPLWQSKLVDGEVTRSRRSK